MKKHITFIIAALTALLILASCATSGGDSPPMNTVSETVETTQINIETTVSTPTAAPDIILDSSDMSTDKTFAKATDDVVFKVVCGGNVYSFNLQTLTNNGGLFFKYSDIEPLIKSGVSWDTKNRKIYVSGKSAAVNENLYKGDELSAVKAVNAAIRAQNADSGAEYTIVAVSDSVKVTFTDDKRGADVTGSYAYVSSAQPDLLQIGSAVFVLGKTADGYEFEGYR